MFISLTEVTAKKSEKELIINTAHIMSVQKSEKTADTHLRMADRSFFFVKQGIAEIERMLLTDYTRPPMLMDKKLAKELGLAK